MKHLPSQVMLNSTNVNYTNPTLKNVLLPITKKKGTLFHLYSVCLVSCAKIPNTCYTHVYIYNYMCIYIYNTYTLCIDIIVPFRTFVLATNTDKMIHCHILLMHWFSRFWRGSQSSINGMMNFSARRGWFGHLGKRSCFRCRGFFWCGRDVRFPWRGRRWLQFLGDFSNQRISKKNTTLWNFTCNIPNDSQDNTNLCWKSSSFSFIFGHFQVSMLNLEGAFTTVKPRIPLKNIHPLPCFWWNLLHTPGFTMLKYTPKCEELPQVAYTSRAAQKHPNNSQHRILDLRRHNRPLQTNMAPENLWNGASFSKSTFFGSHFTPTVTFCPVSSLHIFGVPLAILDPKITRFLIDWLGPNMGPGPTCIISHH